MSHLLFQRTTGGEIADGANVFFNNQVWLSDDITYNEDTGVFTIETEGFYEINWNIAAQSSQAATGLSFVIDAAGSTDITDSTPIKTGQLSGISVIVADQPPVDFSLRNVSGQSVYLPDQTDVKATISLISVGGPPGATGATGPEGPPGASAIIPYSSGSPVTLTSLVGGLVGLPAFVGFGSSAQGIDALGATINLEGTVLGLDQINFAFFVPRDGTITGLTAFFSVVLAVGVGVGDYNIHAALYRSEQPATNEFDAIPGADVTLTPGFTGPIISLGEIARGSLDLNIDVFEGDRLLLVFYVEPPALSLAASITGYASAGLTID